MRRTGHGALLAAAALATTPLEAADTASRDLTLDAATGFTIPARVQQRAVRLRVDLEASPFVVLNPGAVSRIGLSRSRLPAHSRVGPIRLDGYSRRVALRVADTNFHRRAVWMRGHVAVRGADGVISAANIPYDRVIFQIRPPRGDEIRHEVQLAYGRFGLHFPFAVGNEQIEFRFSLLTPQTMATAAAGALLAEHLDGRWTGEATERVVRFDIARPVRPMTLGNPFDIAGFRGRQLLVRTSDNRGLFELPDDRLADPEEIVVTGVVERQRPAFTVSIGMDRLQNCSRLVYTRATNRLSMDCSR